MVVRSEEAVDTFDVIGVENGNGESYSLYNSDEDVSDGNLKEKTSFQSAREQKTCSIDRQTCSVNENALNLCSRVEDFAIGETLGKGKYGEVKLAKHVPTSIKVAIKFVPKGADIEAAHKEISSLLKIQHNNIVQLYDVLETNSHFLLVLELMSGGELFDFIVARNHLSENECRRFFQQLIKSIHRIHSNGIIHRDLKLENLMLDVDGKLKLSDFGFSNVLPSDPTKDLMSTFCGSPAYAAPEIIKNKFYLGPPVDIWSIGVILYAMVKGKLPFADENDQSTNRKRLCSANYTMPTSISDELSDLLSNILVVDPSKRLTIEQIAKHPWVCRGSESVDLLSSSDADIIRFESLCEDTVLAMKKMNIDPHSLLQMLKEKRCNRITCTYRLLERHIRLEKHAKQEELLIAQKARDIAARFSNASCTALGGRPHPFAITGPGGRQRIRRNFSIPSSTKAHIRVSKRLSLDSKELTCPPIVINNKNGTESQDSESFVLPVINIDKSNDVASRHDEKKLNELLKSTTAIPTTGEQVEVGSQLLVLRTSDGHIQSTSSLSSRSRSRDSEAFSSRSRMSDASLNAKSSLNSIYPCPPTFDRSNEQKRYVRSSTREAMDRANMLTDLVPFNLTDTNFVSTSMIRSFSFDDINPKKSSTLNRIRAGVKKFWSKLKSDRDSNKSSGSLNTSFSSFDHATKSTSDVTSELEVGPTSRPIGRTLSIPEENAMNLVPLTSPTLQVVSPVHDTHDENVMNWVPTASFSAETISNKQPEDIVRIIARVLVAKTIKHTVNGFSFRCESLGVRFGIELCRVARLSMYGLRFIRFHGDCWEYKSICQDIVKTLNL